MTDKDCTTATLKFVRERKLEDIKWVGMMSNPTGY
jgi:hypothetical protein